MVTRRTFFITIGITLLCLGFIVLYRAFTLPRPTSSDQRQVDTNSQPIIIQPSGIIIYPNGTTIYPNGTVTYQASPSSPDVGSHPLYSSPEEEEYQTLLIIHLSIGIGLIILGVFLPIAITSTKQQKMI